MPYSKQTWANDAAGNTPLSASRLTVMENGIEAASLELVTIPDTGEWLTSQFGSGNASGGSQNEAIFVPVIVVETMTLSGIAVTVNSAVAASVVRLGVYRSNSKNKPGALAFDAGTVDASTTGVKQIAINQILTPGIYWTVAIPQNGAPSIRGFSNIQGLWAVGNSNLVIQTPGQNYYNQTGITGALPTNAIPAFAGNGNTAHCTIVGLIRA